uniref:ATP synthase subunit a n=1 Tax=Wasmannia auropunctata TaxID=64793 RepID=A0A191TFU2_WASAN|nr:ATP synthase F0 subunit 6 [Wasmannia auropunctata]ANI87503.1 ATP synthase F0 subunit 6 [Wasmannia auropunctata]
MMMNIFSIFDPSSSSNLSLNWISMFLMFTLLPFQMWIIPTRFTLLWNYCINYIFKEFKVLINYSFSNLITFASLITFIFFNNFLGLFPYIFTASSHMSICLSLSLPLWLGMMIYSITNYFNDLMTHLTPSGTPFILMPFMVIIESISLLIRPFTLAIRLTANMIAGHLLLSLLGSSGQSISNMFMLNFLILTQILLFILEISVSLIQAYVFSVLSTLYSSES